MPWIGLVLGPLIALFTQRLRRADRLGKELVTAHGHDAVAFDQMKIDRQAGPFAGSFHAGIVAGNDRRIV